MRHASKAILATLVLSLSARGEGIEFGVPMQIDLPERTPALAFTEFDVEAGFDLLTLRPGGGRVSLRVNDGGVFLDPTEYAVLSGVDRLTTAELTDDVYTDAVVSSSSRGQLAILRYDFPGVFTVIDRPDIGGVPVDLDTGDLDGDGHTDIAVADVTGNRIVLFFNDGTGTFTESDAFITAAQPTGVSIGDLNGDGHADIVVSSFLTDSVSVHMGQEGRTFISAGTMDAGSQPSAVATGDFDGDGLMDVLVANQNSGSLSFFAGDGDGGFAPERVLPAGSQPVDIDAVDIDRDGDTDAVITLARQPAFALLENTKAGPVVRTFALPGLALNADVGDLDGDGMPDLAFAASEFRRVWVVPNTTEPPDEPAPCPADCDGNREVEFGDLICALFQFGLSGFEASDADCNESGVVDFDDLICILFSFGPCDG